MELVSNAVNGITYSTLKTHKRGLSLTSRSKCSSLSGKRNNLQSQQTMVQPGAYSHLQSCSYSHRQSHSMSKVDSQSGVSNWSIPAQTPHIQRNLALMTKITFRYSNQTLKTAIVPRANRFLQQKLLIRPKQAIQYPCQIKLFQDRNLKAIPIQKQNQSNIMIKSNLNQSPHVYKKQEMNSNRNLIDSRRIQRQIVHQQVRYYQVPSIVINVKPALDQNDFVTQRYSSAKNTPIVDDVRSPYCMLASTAKKYQSQQIMISVFNQNQKSSDLLTNLVQKTTQIKNSALNLIEECSQEIYQENQPSITILQDLTFKNKLQECALNDYKQKSQKPILLSNQIQTKSKKKRKQNPSKDSALQQIQNKAPLNEQQHSVSGRRNIGRIRQIQTRLQQIIKICNNNL